MDQRTGSGHSHDVTWFISNVLNPNGLTFRQGDEAIDLTVVSQAEGLRTYTPWLEVGQLAVDGGVVTAAWLAGIEPGPLRTPLGWTYDKHVGLKYNPGHPADHMTPIPTSPTMLEGFDAEAGRRVFSASIYGDRISPPIPEELSRLIRKRLEEMVYRALRIHNHNWSGRPTRDQPEIDKLKIQLEDDLRDTRALTRGLLATDPIAHFTEGHILTALGRHPEAEVSHRKAFALAPNWSDSAGELIASLAYQGKVDEAIEVGGRAHKLHPDHHVIGLNLAINLHSKGRDDEAIAVLDRVAQAGPPNLQVETVKRSIQAKRKRQAGLLHRLFSRR